MGHRVHESFVVLPLKLCVKFELSIIKDYKKYLRKSELQFGHTSLPTLRCTKWVWSARETKNLWGHVTLATALFEKFLRGHVHTAPGNIHVKFEVRSFNRFGSISI